MKITLHRDFEANETTHLDFHQTSCSYFLQILVGPFLLVLTLARISTIRFGIVYFSPSLSLPPLYIYVF